MLHWFRAPKPLPVALTLGLACWSGIFPGIYGAYASAEAATAFVQNARNGQGVGTSILNGATVDASQSGSSDFGGLGITPPAGWKSKLESYYVAGSSSLTAGNALNQYADARGALLSDTSCPNNWSTVTTDLSTAMTDYRSMVSLCGQRIQAFDSVASNDASDPTLVTQAEGDESSWLSTTESASSTVEDLSTQCSQAPACDVANTQATESVAALWDSSTQGLPALQSYCSALPASPSQQQLPAESADVTSIINRLNSLGYANSTVKSVGSACSYAESYKAAHSGVSNLNAYTNPTSALGDTLDTTNFLKTSTGAKLEQEFLPLIVGNPDVFEQYYNPANCTKKTTYYGNSGTTVSTPPTTVVQSGANPNHPVACNTSGEHTGWVTNFPDQSAEYIWGGINDCQDVPNGDTETFETVYQNGGNGTDQNASISATMYLAIDDQGTATISGTQAGQTEQVTYSDGGGNPIANNLPDGWISQSVILYPGTNTITITDKNDDAGTSASNPAGALMAIMGSSNQVYIATNSTQWNWVNAPTNPPTTTEEPGASVNTGAPSASATSNLCTGTISCLGTQCHAVMGNQNLDFNKAVTASSAISMMQTDAKCQTGTSMAAGNCIPIIFQGHAMYCRNFPLSGAGFTNNCCKESMAGPGIPLGKYIKLVMNSYAISSSSILQGTVLGDPYKWGEAAYKSLSGYAEQAWNYVSQPFINVAESVAQDIMNDLPSQMSALFTEIGGSAAATGAGSLVSDAFGLASNFSSMAAAYVEAESSEAISSVTGISLNAANAIVSDIADFVDVVMIAYEVYQIAQLIGNLLTTCKNEEYTFGDKRKEDDCYIVGSYCAHEAPIIGCTVTKTMACCYQSPLAMIIASQIQTNQPNIAGGYGTPSDINCAGFTVPELADVNWNEINLSQWLALIQQAGLIQTTNQSAASSFDQNTQDHPSGQVNPN